jgi:hypothetical protein
VQERALQHLFGKETASHTDQYELEVKTAARRILSLLLSLKVGMRDILQCALDTIDSCHTVYAQYGPRYQPSGAIRLEQEFPAIRFRVAKPTGDDPVLEARALTAQRVAIEINDRLLALQEAGVASSTGESAAHHLVCCEPHYWRMASAFVGR